MFICGTLEGLIPIGGRRHNTEDLIATVMAVEPHSFIYKGRIVVFSVTVLREERIVVVAEQKPNCTDEEAFTWMNSVVPAVDSIHGVSIYGIVLTSAGRLPRGASGTVQVHETKQNFLEGSLHPVNLLMCPHQCITNLPTPKPHACECSRRSVPSSHFIRGTTCVLWYCAFVRDCNWSFETVYSCLVLECLLNCVKDEASQVKLLVGLIS